MPMARADSELLCSVPTKYSESRLAVAASVSAPRVMTSLR